MKRSFIFFLAMLLVMGSILPILPMQTVKASTIPPVGNFKGVPIMYMDSNKTTKKPDESGKPVPPDPFFDFVKVATINGNPMYLNKDSDFTLQEMQVRVTGALPGGQEIVGTTIALVDYHKTDDNGYPMINSESLATWVSLLGGELSYVQKYVAPYVVQSNTVGSFTLYSLAQVVYLCGGKGLNPGFVPHPNPPYSWVKWQGIAYFEQTPRPTANIDPLQPEYPLNSKIKITGHARSYSAYDRFVILNNFVIYNKTKNTLYTYIDTAGQKGEVWDSPASFEFVASQEGVYEVLLYATDYQERKPVGYPVKATFRVGNPPPGGDGGDPPAPTCSINSSNTKLDIRVEGDKNDRDLTNVSSGGSLSVEKYAHIILTAKKAGTFTLNGSTVLSPGTGNNRKVGVVDAPGSGSFSIQYTSDDGTECWVKTLVVEQDRTGQSCPIVEVNGSVVGNNETLTITAGERLSFVSTFKNGTDVEPAEVYWEITKPDGASFKLPMEQNDRGKWVPLTSSRLTLPNTNQGYPPQYTALLNEPGSTYRVRLVFAGTLFEDKNCRWDIQIKVRGGSCSITEQNRIAFTAYGEPPAPYPSGGERLGSEGRELYFHTFTSVANGYDTHMSLSADVAGTFYLESRGKQIPLSQGLQANERFRLVLPTEIEQAVGSDIRIIFLSDNGCERVLVFPLLSDRSCYFISLSLETSTRVGESFDVRRGETLTIQQSHFDGGYGLVLYTGVKTEFTLYMLDPVTQTFTRKYNGKTLSSSDDYRKHHSITIPKDPTTGKRVEGLYMVSFFDEDNMSSNCDGHFFIQVGPGEPVPDGENLLILKNSFTITPNSPQKPGTATTIKFDVKNAGKLEHDTTLAVRWESSTQATFLEIKDFKPGEVRTITVPTKYPQKPENFIGNINPNKDRPDNETNWTDNRAEWPVDVSGPVPPDPPGGGGNFDGGQIILKLFDSDDRELQLSGDGVWEKEPTKIKVVIDQTKINEGFEKTEQAINNAIVAYKARLQQVYSGSRIRNLVVTATPGWITNAKSLAVYKPPVLDLRVSGPGQDQAFQVSSASMGGEFLYTGTNVPTSTTWRKTLQTEKYKAEINGFTIDMPYRVDFAISYEVERCYSVQTGTDKNGKPVFETICTYDPQRASETMQGLYTITVQGGFRTFDVFEPNAKLVTLHTPEWIDKHKRDRYKDSTNQSYYAGEAILTHVILEERHRHPVSREFPVIHNATSWMRELGGVGKWIKRARSQGVDVREHPTWHQKTLALVPRNGIWQGPLHDIVDPNGLVATMKDREEGVDTGFGQNTMGDIWKGLQKGESYAVYSLVSFQFGVQKGFPTYQKDKGMGSATTDYTAPIDIIDNAYAWVVYRTHLK